MFQLISGIVLCHRKKIMHRDLKPSNLLLDHESNFLNYGLENLIIGDFGCARKFGGSSLTCQTYSQPVVTFPYRAP
jgi:cyclin-dependent kinase